MENDIFEAILSYTEKHGFTSFEIVDKDLFANPFEPGILPARMVLTEGYTIFVYESVTKKHYKKEYYDFLKETGTYEYELEYKDFLSKNKLEENEMVFYTFKKESTISIVNFFNRQKENLSKARTHLNEIIRIEDLKI